MRKNVFVCILIFVLVLSMAGCGSSTNTNGVPDPDKIVPKREVLIENLENSGYTITILTTIDGSDLTVDRVMAQKGDKFIDIVYGLSAEDSSNVFELYSGLYSDDYIITDLEILKFNRSNIIFSIIVDIAKIIFFNSFIAINATSITKDFIIS